MNWPWFERLREFKHPHGYRGVGLALAIRAKNDKPTCYPSITTLSKDASVCRQTVVRAVELFESQGLLKVQRKGGKVNRYTLLTSLPGRRAPVHHRDGLPVYGVDGSDIPNPSTPQTGPVYGVDTKRNSNCAPEQEERGRLNDAEVPY